MAFYVTQGRSDRVLICDLLIEMLKNSFWKKFERMGQTIEDQHLNFSAPEQGLFLAIMEQNCGRFHNFVGR